MASEVVRRRLGLVVALSVVGWAAPLGFCGQTEPCEETKPLELDVPYVPTQEDAVTAMLKLAKVTSADYVFDLGCGDGRIVVTAAKDFKARGFGVDLDPERIKESNENAAKAGVTERVKFKLEDIFVTDVREASVVALFLLESVNLRLRPRLLSQLKPGARVVSNTFTMGEWKADQVLRHEKAYGKVIYLWIVPAPVGGTWQWKTKTSGEEMANSLRLRQQFQVVRGTVRFPGGGGVPITEVSLTGKKIQFTAAPTIAQKEVKIVYQGTVEGDTIQGTQRWLSGPSAGTYPWMATRDPLDVTGRWQISVREHADRNGTLTIQRKDKSLLATFAAADKPQEEVSLPGLYVWGSSIRVEIPNDDSPVVFSGSLTADAGRGTVTGATVTKRANWTAKRVPSK